MTYVFGGTLNFALSIYLSVNVLYGHSLRPFYFTTTRLLIDLENLFSNAHSRDEYLCQVSLKSFH